MQLKTLSGFENQLRELSRDRHQRADADYDEGIAALARARDSGYSDRAALLAAGQKLLGALQRNRTSPRPYLALGYLFLLTGDRERARRYLGEAMRLDPGSELARDLLESLDAVRRVSLDAGDTLKRLQTQPAVSDYDALYEQLEAGIRTALQRLMQQPHPAQPSPDPEARAALAARSAELEGLASGFGSQITSLEAGLDTSALCQLLRPLEVLIHRYRRACALSETFADILAEIDASKHQTRILIHRLQFRHEDVNRELELRLDDCDAIADRLDALSDQKVDIAAVESHYRELIELVNVLQELLDEQA